MSVEHKFNSEEVVGLATQPTANLLAWLSHDINNQLALIMAIADRMQDGASESVIKNITGYGAKILTATDQIRQLVTTINAFYCAAGETPVAPVQITKIIHDAHIPLQKTFKRTQCEVVYNEIDEKQSVLVKADRASLVVYLVLTHISQSVEPMNGKVITCKFLPANGQKCLTIETLPSTSSLAGCKLLELAALIMDSLDGKLIKVEKPTVKFTLEFSK